MVLLWKKNRVKTNHPVQVEQIESDCVDSDHEIPGSSSSSIGPIASRCVLGSLHLMRKVCS